MKTYMSAGKSELRGDLGLPPSHMICRWTVAWSHTEILQVQTAHPQGIPSLLHPVRLESAHSVADVSRHVSGQQLSRGNLDYKAGLVVVRQHLQSQFV